MKTRNTSFVKTLHRTWALISCAMLLPGAMLLGADAETDLAARILKDAGRTVGWCVDLGCGDGKLSAALVAQSELYVHGLETNDTRVAAARATLEATGQYAKRCSVERGSLGRLPYPDYCANVIVRGDYFADGLRGLSLKEVIRVLQPGGVAYLGQPTAAKVAKKLTEEKLKGWLTEAGIKQFEIVKDGGVWAKIRRARPEGMGDWSHGVRASAGNGRSVDDTLVKAPFLTGWIGGPRSFTKFGVIAASEGRFFLRHGGITHTGRWKPGKKGNTIQAFDGWNGTKLWSTQLPEPNGSGLVCAGGLVFANGGSLMVAMDANDGKILWQKRPDAFQSDLKEWAYYGFDGGVLVTTLRDETRQYKSRSVPAAKLLVAMDSKTGEKVWSCPPKPGMRSIALGDGRVFISTGGAVSALDIRTGEQQWETNRRTKGGLHYYREKLYMQNGIFDSKDGKLLNGKGPRGMLVGDRLVGGGIGGVGVYDAKTGKRVLNVKATTDPYSPKTGVPKGGIYGRCIPRTASTHCYFFTYSGTVIADLLRGKMFPAETFRANCRTGVIAGNGVVYNSPSGCGCTFVIRGGAALVPVDEAFYDGKAESNPPPQLEKGPAFADKISASDGAGHWPAFRGTPARDCAARTAITFPLNQSWATKLTEPVTEPIVAGNRVFVGSKAHAVIALDAETGKQAWRFPTGGAVQAAPTYWRGRVYAGSHDGWVYCLNAESGKLIWRFRGAPHERKLFNDGRPQSVWPVAGGVIAEEGKIWFYAGLCSHDKVYIHCLNAESGEVIWSNDTLGTAVDVTGPEGGVSPHGVSPVGILCASKDVLYIPHGSRWPAGIRKSDGKILWWNKRGDSKERSNVNIQHLGGAELSYGGGFLFMGGRSPVSGHNQFFYALHGSNGRIWGQDDPRHFKTVMRREDGSTILPQSYKWGVGSSKFGKSVAPVVVGEDVLVFAHYPGCFNLKAKLKGARKGKWGVPGGAVAVCGKTAIFGGGKAIDARDVTGGKRLWKATIKSEGNIKKNALAAAHGSVFLATNANEIVRFSPTPGKKSGEKAD